MECSSPLVRFCRYMNVPIASARNRRGSLELCDISQVLLVVTLFDEGEYGTDEMIQMSCSSQSSFIRLATSSFAWSNITVLTISFSIRLTHFPNLIGVFDFTLQQAIFMERQSHLLTTPLTGSLRFLHIASGTSSLSCSTYVEWARRQVEAAPRSCVTWTPPSCPPGLDDPAVNRRHGRLAFVKHNISGLLHS